MTWCRTTCRKWYFLNRYSLCNGIFRLRRRLRWFACSAFLFTVFQFRIGLKHSFGMETGPGKSSCSNRTNSIYRQHDEFILIEWCEWNALCVLCYAVLAACCWIVLFWYIRSTHGKPITLPLRMRHWHSVDNNVLPLLLSRVQSLLLHDKHDSN